MSGMSLPQRPMFQIHFENPLHDWKPIVNAVEAFCERVNVCIGRERIIIQTMDANQKGLVYAQLNKAQLPYELDENALTRTGKDNLILGLDFRAMKKSLEKITAAHTLTMTYKEASSFVEMLFHNSDDGTTETVKYRVIEVVADPFQVPMTKFDLVMPLSTQNFKMELNKLMSRDPETFYICLCPVGLVMYASGILAVDNTVLIPWPYEPQERMEVEKEESTSEDDDSDEEIEEEPTIHGRPRGIRTGPSHTAPYYKQIVRWIAQGAENIAEEMAVAVPIVSDDDVRNGLLQQLFFFCNTKYGRVVFVVAPLTSEDQDEGVRYGTPLVPMKVRQAIDKVVTDASREHPKPTPQIIIPPPTPLEPRRRPETICVWCGRTIPEEERRNGICPAGSNCYARVKNARKDKAERRVQENADARRWSKRVAGYLLEWRDEGDDAKIGKRVRQYVDREKKKLKKRADGEESADKYDDMDDSGSDGDGMEGEGSGAGVE